MKLKYLTLFLVIFIVLIMLIAGCENVDVSKVSDKDLERISDKAVVCDKPYIRVGMECCLDQNDNKICDKDETKITQKEEANETKKDKCSDLDEAEGLTSTEREEELNICYQGKYIDYATSTDNLKVCEEIVKPWYYSPCIASVASKRNDINLCKKLRYEEWEAKGYYEKLNTKDLCYFLFATYGYMNMSATEIEDVCNKVSDTQMKTQCLALKELSSLFSDNWLSDEEETEEESKIEVISHSNKTSYGYLYITGEVKNIGNTTAKSVKVTAKFYKDDQFVDRDYTYVDNSDIPAGETDTFEIMWQIQDYDRYELTAK